MFAFHVIAVLGIEDLGAAHHAVWQAHCIAHVADEVEGFPFRPVPVGGARGTHVIRGPDFGLLMPGRDRRVHFGLERRGVVGGREQRIVRRTPLSL